MEEEIRKTVRREPWEIIQSTADTFNKASLDHKSKIQIGSLTISPNAEYFSSGKIRIFLYGIIGIRGSYQRIPLEKQQLRPKTFLEKISCDDILMLKNFYFKKLVKNRFNYFLCK